MNVLTVDIGGTHIKFRTQRHTEPVKVKSGPKMTPDRMVKAIHACTEEGGPDWKYDRVSLGYPGLVIHDTPITEPHNLAAGWLKFKFGEAFRGKPVQMMNDAAMQALGSHRGGRMLFFGLGTGLGSAMVVEGAVQDMALAHLPWKKGKTFEEFLGAAALERNGRKVWRKHLDELLDHFHTILESDYVVLGGGNAKLATKLPEHVTLGSNENAFKGGFLLWDKAANES